MRNYTEDKPTLSDGPSLLMELPQAALLDVLSIDEATVRANRAGRLTHDQQQFVGQRLKSDQDGIWFLTTIFLGTLVVLAIIFLLQGLGRESLLLGGGVFFAAFGAFAYNRLNQEQRDLSVKVGKAVGDLRVIKSGSLSQWGLVIGDKFFAISEALAHKFDGYRTPLVAAYYTIGTNTLLSMEVLEDEKRKNDDLTIDEDDEDEVEMPLASWDKPKNTLALDETSASSAKEEPESQTTEDAAPSQSKRRF